MRRSTPGLATVALLALTLGAPASASFTELGVLGTGPGSGAGQLDRPEGVAVAPDGSVYVADAANTRVVKFAPGGGFERTWGKDVDAGGGTGFEVCAITCKTGVGGSAAGELQGVEDVAVSPDGLAVYVADDANRRVSQYNPDGTFVRAWGKDVVPGGSTGPEVCVTPCKTGIDGAAGGELTRPGAVAVAPSGDVYVTETINTRISQFTAAGTFVRAVGVDVDTGGGTGLETCSATCREGGFFDVFGDWDAIGVTGSGEVYVTTDQGSGLVARFSGVGAYLGSFAGEGSGPGAVQDPQAVDVSPSGEVLLAQSDPPTVFRYLAGPTFLESFSVGAVLNDEPSDVAFGIAGDAYVAQGRRDRVVRYALSGTPGPPPAVPVPALIPAPAPAVVPVPAPPSVAPAARPPLPAAASVIVLPSSRRCVSRRNFRIRLKQPKGLRLRSATVSVNGRRVATRSGTRITAPVDLRGLPKGRFTVKIVATLTDGRKLSSVRRYRTCAPRTGR